jgi:hypothetical protein
MIKEITLPSGKIAKLEEYKGKHIREASKIADGDQTKLMFALISLCATIDDQPILMEDLDEMNGRDVMMLMTEFNDANF